MLKHNNNSVPCEECKSIARGWCKSCNSKRFEANFEKWTSGVIELDKFIYKTQTTSERHETVFEWVDPSKFTRLENIEFSKDNKAYWEDGYLVSWNIEKNEWNRNSGQWVKLTTYYGERYLISNFLEKEHEFSKTNPLKRLVYGMTRDPTNNRYAVVEKLEKQCLSCDREWMSPRWCRGCYSDQFESEFQNWTSGNADIDAYIRGAQTTAEFPEQVLEWIPEAQLTEITQIGKGGYGTVYKAHWKNGRICKRNFIMNEWERAEPIWVALKSIEEEGESIVGFLKEAESIHKCLKTDMYALDFYGISKHPVTRKYLIVMRYVEEGDLRKYLFSNFANDSWENRIDRLWSIAVDLRILHSSNLVHRDLHSGNVLFGKDRRSFISDFGLTCEDGQAQDGKVKGVLPYIAPEILCGKPHTKAADIYGFGIIMWEWTSCRPPFCDMAYDIGLALNVCSGLRPPVIKGTPECYVQLMKQCWDPDPEKRPTTHFLAETLEIWYQILSNKYDESKEHFTDDNNIRKQFELAELERQKNPFPYSSEPNTHPKAILTSRVLPLVSLPSEITQETEYQTLQYNFVIRDTD